MIKLDIEKYCYNCPDFEADVYKQEISALHRTFDPLVVKGDITYETVIKCKNRKRCSMIAEYFSNSRNEQPIL